MIIDIFAFSDIPSLLQIVGSIILISGITMTLLNKNKQKKGP